MTGLSMRVARLLLVALVLSASALVATVADASVRDRAVVQWRSCAGQFRCASIAVPIDYSNPSRGTLRLSVVMLPSTSSHPIGDVFTNPGGPGASGVQFLEQNASSFPGSLRASFNVVSWDPRGIGASTPAVWCVTPAQLRAFTQVDPAPTTPAEVDQVVAATKQFVSGCQKRTPHAVLANVGTRTTIEDLDTLRADLGQPSLNYLGFSYGSYIGELYAARYPTHIRTMVLDGVINPALGLVGSDRQQAVGFEGDLKAFFSWCNANASCHKELPQGARVAYDALVTRLASGNTDTATFKSRFGGTQPVTWGVAELGVISTLYTESFWPYLGQAIQQGLQGNGNLLAELAYEYEGLQNNGQFDNEEDANVAVNCVDSPSPRSLGFYENLARQLTAAAPDFGASEAWGSLICAYWPYSAQGTPAPVRAVGSPKIVLVGSTNDPATPYEWAVQVSHQLANSVLLTRDGSGHTGYFFSSCIRNWVDNYLVTTKAPPAHTTCPSD